MAIFVLMFFAKHFALLMEYSVAPSNLFGGGLASKACLFCKFFSFICFAKTNSFQTGTCHFPPTPYNYSFIELCKIEVRHILFKKISSSFAVAMLRRMEFLVFLNNQINVYWVIAYRLKRKN